VNEIVYCYGMDKSLKTVDYGPISIEQALRVIDDRFEELGR